MQGFGGTLTMLDGRAGGGMQESGQSDYGGGDAGGNGCQARRSVRPSQVLRGGGAPEGGDFDKHLDDESHSKKTISTVV